MLPKQKRKPLSTEPKHLLVYGPPKIGKTSMAAELPNHLILDFEHGSEYVEANSVKILDLEVPPSEKRSKEERAKVREFYLTEVLEMLAEDCPYDYIVLDTLTAIEERAEFWATWKYMNTSQGKTFNRTPSGTMKSTKDWELVTNKPNGAGYLQFREAYKSYIKPFRSLPATVIYFGHVRDKVLTKNRNEINVKDLDLTGKNKTITTATIVDAIGYIYRKNEKEKMQNIVTFKGSEELLCGTRCEYLTGKDFVVSEMKDGKVTVNWNEIYPSTKTK